MKLNTAAVTSSQPPHNSRLARSSIRPGGLAGQPQRGNQPDQRSRQQPGHLGPHRLAEHPADARLAAEEDVARPAEATVFARTATGLAAAGDAVNSVVAQRQLQQAVRGGAADVGPRVGRPQLDESDVPTRRRDHRGGADHQLPDSLPHSDGCGDQERQRQARHHQEGLQHLRQEGEAERRTGQRHPPGAAVSVARTTKYAAATINRTSSASGLLNRNISAATGVSARAAPAIRPAPGPLTRRTAA